MSPSASPDGTGQEGRGLVKAFRYGLFAERKARIVLDTTGPVRIERAAMTVAGPNGKGIVFTFDLRRRHRPKASASAQAPRA